MKMLRLTLPIRPLSYNQYYRNTRTGKRIKTGSGLAYDEILEGIILGYSNELLSFGKLVDQSKHIISFSLRIANPRFYIKDGSRINKTAGDVDNYVKILQDKISRAMGVDDYLFRRGSQFDFPSDKDLVMISLEILPHPPFRSCELLSELF
jgi:hypothetical protein